MITITTNSIEGKAVVAYKGIVFGEATTGIHTFRDLGAGSRNIFGGHSKSYENGLMGAKEKALVKMAECIKALGANMIIGVKMNYEVLGSDNGMLMVICSGTAASTR